MHCCDYPEVGELVASFPALRLRGPTLAPFIFLSARGRQGLRAHDYTAPIARRRPRGDTTEHLAGFFKPIVSRVPGGLRS